MGVNIEYDERSRRRSRLYVYASPPVYNQSKNGNGAVPKYLGGKRKPRQS
jgi:hypothetical protein